MRLVAFFSWFLWLLVVPIIARPSDGLQTALAGLESEDSASYERAAAFLIKHPKEAQTPLRAKFQDASKSPLARLRAVKLLGDMSDSEAANDMRKTLDGGSEENEAVRREIIRSLSKIGRSDIIIDYLKSGKEKSPVVIAAIALTLQGESSKDALGRLLASSDDPRVFRAATLAIYQTYRPTLGTLETAWSGNAKGASGNQTPPPQRTFAASDGTARAKLELTSGDRAIFSALRAKKADKDPEISKAATDLLAQLSEAYKAHN